MTLKKNILSSSEILVVFYYFVFIFVIAFLDTGLYPEDDSNVLSSYFYMFIKTVIINGLHNLGYTRMYVEVP
jgi:hypothetical protein